ncbi:MAG: hypothetical protein KC491_14795, partial [Dehalococcoidia bacterium]|nr:hypothetical protein [Dehalococcoidia bacterium]
LADKVLALRTMPDAIVDHGPQTTFRAVYGLDGTGLAELALAKLAFADPGKVASESLPIAGGQ